MLNNNFKNMVLLGSTSGTINNIVIDEAGNGQSASKNSLYMAMFFDSFRTTYDATVKNVAAIEPISLNFPVAMFGFGTSNAPATVNDITVADFENNSYFTLQSGSKTAISANAQNITFSQIFKYEGSKPMEIKEIGLFLKHTLSANAKVVMYAREVLVKKDENGNIIEDNSITVNNGDIFTVSMVIG